MVHRRVVGFPRHRQGSKRGPVGTAGRRGRAALCLLSVVPVAAVLVAAGDTGVGRSPTPVSTQSEPGRGHWVLVFQDNFDGTSLDKSKWSNGFGWGRTSRSELAYCNPANNSLRGGALVQRIDRRAGGGRSFSAGCVNTRRRFSKLYGYWEARIRVAGCPGARGAFWAKPNDESWPPELDVVEVHGHERRVALLTVHWRQGGSIRRSKGSFLGPDFSAGYHVFGAEWTPTETIWSIDGVERRRTPAGANFLDDRGPFYLMVNNQVVRRSSTCGRAGSSSSQYVDYVRVWTRSGAGR